MIRYIFAIFIAAATSQAETIKEAVASRRPRLQDPAEILRELTAPRMVAVTNQVVTTKSAEQLAWEQFAAAEIADFMELVTNDRTNAVKRIGQIDSKAMIRASRAKKAGSPAKAQELNDLAIALMVLRADAAQRGYPWPLPAHFGQATYTETVEVVTPAPSIFAAAFPGVEPPTVEQVASLME